MPARSDTLPRPAKRDRAAIRLDLSAEQRDKLRMVAAERGYSMATFLRLWVAVALAEPTTVQKKVSRNSRKEG